MPAALLVLALLIAFFSVAGFLFGQLFAGVFFWPATLVGLGGVVAAGPALAMAVRAAWAPRWALRASIASLLGLALDVAHYYARLDIPGNYYGWGMTGPFVGCLLALAWLAWRRRSGES